MAKKIFTIYEEEMDTLREWVKTLPPNEPGCLGGVGLRLTYCFSGCGIGTACVVKDNQSGEEKDITNYDCW